MWWPVLCLPHDATIHTHSLFLENHGVAAPAHVSWKQPGVDCGIGWHWLVDVSRFDHSGSQYEELQQARRLVAELCIECIEQ